MTLKEIAALAGTSPSTVSRVINRTSPTCASKELQDKIWEVVRETGYRPNETARLLKKGERVGADIAPVHISIVMARISSLEGDPFFSELFRSLEVELMEQGIVLDGVIYAEEGPLPQKVSASDGVLILGRCSGSLLQHITAQNRSVVGIWRNPTEFHVDEVVCDGKKAAEMAMQYLISLGHRQIAYIGDCSFESRYVGYCETLIQSRIPMNYRLIKQTDQTRAAAECAFGELLADRLAGTVQFSAIFCANDNTAVRILELLQEKKKLLRGQKISVISIDDIEEAQNTKPYLTTIHIPRREMAHMAVLLLLDRIAKGHTENLRNEFPCRLIRRTSCYPV